MMSAFSRCPSCPVSNADVSAVGGALFQREGVGGARAFRPSPNKAVCSIPYTLGNDDVQQVRRDELCRRLCFVNLVKI